MTSLLKFASVALFAFPVWTRAQSIPADTGSAPPGVGFTLPRVGGSLSYALNASEVISNGFYTTWASFSTNFSGDLAYVSKSQRHPFSAVYDGGVLIGNTNQPTTTFQSLSLSQVYSTKHWNFVVADAVSYLPQSPLGGLSGIPGVGDLGVDPVTVGPTSGLGILTLYGPRVSNLLSATAGRQLTGHISVQATGTLGLQRFIGDNSNQSLSSTTEGGSVGLSYHFSARDTLTASYNFSNFAYTSTDYSFTTQGATLDYSRQWSRRFTTDVYAGPQIISGSNALINGTSAELAAGASASYLSRSTTYALSYSRGVNNGSGVVPGAFSDNIIGSAHRRLGRDWDISGNVGFSRSVSLPNLQVVAFNSKGVSFGGQGSRRFGRSFSGFASYTVQDQSASSSGLAVNGIGGLNAFNGVYQVIGLGITYSPRNILLGK